jgi:hypothetical protein
MKGYRLDSKGGLHRDPEPSRWREALPWLLAGAVGWLLIRHWLLPLLH